MATHYGNWAGGNKFRTVIVGSVLSKKASYYKIQYKVYLQTRYYAYDQNGVSAWATGTFSQSTVKKTFNHSGSMQKTYMFTVTKNISRSYGSSTNTSINAKISNVAGYSGTSIASTTYSVPARAYSKPTAPTNFRTTSWNTSKYYLAWTRHPSTAGPYSSQRIEYDYLDSKGNRVGYRHLATVSSGSTSYSRALSTNQIYYFRIRANGSGGSSGWRYFDSGPYVTTTPAPPTATRASTNSTGDAITIKWTANNRVTNSAIRHRIEHQDSPSGAWASVKTGIGYSTTSWTDTSPNAGYNRYRILTAMTGYGPGSGYTYESAWAYSNTINTIVPPLVPTQLKPDGSIVDFNEDVTFTWQHNDGGDGADQSHFKFKIQDGDFVDLYTQTVTSDVSEFVLPGGTLTNGDSYFWKVATQGSTTESYSPEAYETVIGRTPPTITIDTDVTPDVIDELPVAVEWAYQQDEGVPQAQRQIRLQEAIWTGSGPLPTAYPPVFDLDDWDLGDIVIEHEDSGTAVTDTFVAVLDDKAWYVLRGRAMSGAGQWSNWDERYFLVDLLPPAPVFISARYDPPTGSTSLDIRVTEGQQDTRNLASNPSFEETSSTVDVWRNECPNPRAIAGGTKIGRANATDYAVEYGATPPEPSPAGITTASKLSRREGSTLASATFTYVYDTDGYSADQPARSGSVWVYPTVETGITLGGDVHTAPANEWTRFEYSVPENTQLYLDGSRKDAQNADGTEELYYTQVQTQFDASPSTLPPYFDGDYSPDSDLTPVWTGTPGASASKLVGDKLTKVYDGAGRSPVRSSQWADDGNFSARIITQTAGSAAASGINVGDLASYEVGQKVTVIATCHIPEGYDDSQDVAGSRAIQIYSYLADGSVTAPALPGTYPLRATLNVTTANKSSSIRLGGGGLIGQSVYWDNLAIVEGYYSDSWIETFASAAVESYDVQRRINDEDWITIVADIAADDYPSITVLDPIPTIYGTNEYRALVTSIAPSQNFSDVEIVTTGGIIEHDYIFVSFGVTFTELLRMRYNTDIGSSPSRKKDTIELLGRDFPLAVFGRSRSHKLDVQGNLFFLPDNTVDNGSFAWDSAPLEWEYAEFNADIVCYRDALGRRIFGQMTDTTPKIIRDGWGSVSFNIVRSDYVEGATIIPEVGDDI